jgi:flagellar biosynthesis/type III secretory pathway protein FliH
MTDLGQLVQAQARDLNAAYMRGHADGLRAGVKQREVLVKALRTIADKMPTAENAQEIAQAALKACE